MESEVTASKNCHGEEKRRPKKGSGEARKPQLEVRMLDAYNSFPEDRKAIIVEHMEEMAKLFLPEASYC